MNTPLKSKEHYEMIAAFERMSKSMKARVRLDREPKELWSKGCIYQDGCTNELFLAFRLGHAHGAAEAAG